MDSQKMEESQCPRICPICSKAAIKTCSACQSVSYCSIDHQKSDWKSHQINCKAFLIKENEELGRHTVAARDLKEGTIILKEMAVSSAPSTPFSNYGSGNCCLGCNCLMTMTDNPHGKCSKCKWPVCSEACENFENHSENECKIFTEKKIAVFSTDASDILVLRTCLLKHKNPVLWEALKNLQSEHVNKPDSKSNHDLVKFSQKIASFGVSEVVTAEDWIRILKTSNINSFANTITPFIRIGQRERLIQSLFLAQGASLFAHSCAPNCIRDSSPPPHIKIVLRTAVKIKRGEILTIAYYIENNMTGTYKRQVKRPFPCKCLRCKDPLELGSNLSTWVCKKCKQPSMVSTNPLEVNANWKCNSCGEIDTSGGLKIFQMDKLHKIIQDAKHNEKDVNKLKQMVTKYSGINLHPNHWILTEATRKVVQFIGNKRITGELTRDESDFYISACHYLLEVASKVFPGYSLETSQLKRFIAKQRLNKSIDDVKEKILTNQQYQEELKAIKDLLVDAYKFFKLDCTEELINGEGPIALEVKDDICYIDFLLKALETV